ncbi:MAG: 4-fold beta flower protein [Pseudomonadota bacterium]
MDIVFYNINGEATAYTEDGEHIYAYDGRALAYLHDNSVYSYDGKHLGRFSNGWIRDNIGQCVFFTNEAVNGPAKPVRSGRPVKLMKSTKPVKSTKSMRPMKPKDSNTWSSISGVNFFF